jgi:hypothetical protein
MPARCGFLCFRCGGRWRRRRRWFGPAEWLVAGWACRTYASGGVVQSRARAPAALAGIDPAEALDCVPHRLERAAGGGAIARERLGVFALDLTDERIGLAAVHDGLRGSRTNEAHGRDHDREPKLPRPRPTTPEKLRAEHDCLRSHARLRR